MVQLIMARRLVYKKHALHRMAFRKIDEIAIEEVFKSGKIIEVYHDDVPYPSRLVLGFSNNQPIHLVLADNPANNETYVITVYIPEQTEWDLKFEKRHKR